MDRLKAMEVFVAVAREGGFAPAAETLGLSTSSVSRHVANLEDELGVQLLRRTTRQVRLTPAGEEVLEHCETIAAQFDRMILERQAERVTPSGRLRVTMPHFLGTILMKDTVAEFAREYPDVEIEILLVDRIVNLVEEGFDLALRVGKMADSTLVTRKFIDLQLGVIAAPDYIARRGAPTCPADLAHHNCIIDTAAPYRHRWPLRGEAGLATTHTVHGNVTVSGGVPARDLAIGGVGLAYLPEYLFYDDVDAGRLVTVLDDHVIDFGGIFIVSPQTRHRLASIRRFTDLLVRHARPLRQYREARRHAQETEKTETEPNTMPAVV